MILEQPATEQILINADDQLAHVARQTDELSQQVQAYEAELATIHKGQDSRLSEIQDARTDSTRLQDAYDQAVTYSKLSIDTPNAVIATKNVSMSKKELSTAQKQLAQLETKDAEARKAEQTREDELLDMLSQAKAEQEHLTDELYKVKRARTQASRQLAEQKHIANLQVYSEHEARVDAIRMQLVEAQAALLDHHENALQAVEGHPDLQRAIEEKRIHDDATTRLFEATLWYLDAYMANVKDIDKGAKLASLRNAGNGSYQDLLGYLIIQPGELSNFLTRPLNVNPPPTLPATRARLEQLLEEYRAWKRAQE